MLKEILGFRTGGRKKRVKELCPEKLEDLHFSKNVNRC
jgi:hypothetical protein